MILINQNIWLWIFKVLVFLGAVGYIHLFIKRIRKRNKYFKGNIFVSQSGELWIRFKGEEEVLKTITSKMRVIDEEPNNVNERLETDQANIHIEKTSGFVQVTTGNGISKQLIEGNSFSNKLEQYRSLMIGSGILEEDIDALILHAKDEDVKNSFLAKYGMELAKIMVNVAGTTISLISLLKKSI